VATSAQISPLTFRCAVSVDIPALLILIQSAYRGEESRRGWTTEADLLDGRRIGSDGIRQLIATPRSCMLLAVSDGDLVGCCYVEARTGGEAYLGLLSVRPGLQGRGVGRVVVAKAEDEARARWAAAQMRMRVIRQREDLIAWYERLGYRRNGETVPFPYETPGVIAKRSDLEFVVLIKPIDSSSVIARERFAAGLLGGDEGR
jgi:ribosomal protein S18 acetylase RimI-like enzyme